MTQAADEDARANVGSAVADGGGVTAFSGFVVDGEAVADCWLQQGSRIGSKTRVLAYDDARHSQPPRREWIQVRTALREALTPAGSWIWSPKKRPRRAATRKRSPKFGCGRGVRAGPKKKATQGRRRKGLAAAAARVEIGTQVTRRALSPKPRRWRLRWRQRRRLCGMRPLLSKWRRKARG